LAKVFISAERDESAVGRAVGDVRVAFITAVRFAERFDAFKDRRAESARHSFLANNRPTPRQSGKMNEVEGRAVAMRAKEGLDRVARDRVIHGLQPRQREYGVIKIGPASAVKARARWRKLAAKKIADEFGGIAQQTWREAGDLEELEPKAHVARPADGSEVTWRP